MNPKAMPRQQLLGHIDMDTREWADGVLTHSARNVVREPQGKKSCLASLLTGEVLALHPAHSTKMGCSEPDRCLYL